MSAAETNKALRKQEVYLKGLIDDRLKEIAPRKVELTIGDKKIELAPDIRHKLFDITFKAVMCGPVALVGPAGAGKTTLAQQIADALKVPFYFTGAIASEYKLMGFIDANGHCVSTAFREAYTKGGLFLFDEIDASLPQAVLAFNNALANDCCDFPDGNHKRHPEFYVMAAANTYWTGADRVYVGRTQLDGASQDRFIFITIDYDEKMERLLIDSTNEDEVDWLEHVQFAREAVRQLKLRHIISPRSTIYGVKLLRNKVAFKDRETMTIFKGMPAEDIKRVKVKMKQLATEGIEIEKQNKQKEAA